MEPLPTYDEASNKEFLDFIPDEVVFERKLLIESLDHFNGLYTIKLAGQWIYL